MPLVLPDRKDPPDLLVTLVMMVLMEKLACRDSTEKPGNWAEKEKQVTEESKVIKDQKVTAYLATLETRDQRVNVDVPAEPFMVSQGSRVRGDTWAGLDSGAMQVSEDLQVFVSPLGVLS